MTWQGKRYPLASLVEASGLTEAALGRRVKLSGTTLKQARLTGLTEAAADRYALRAGLWPSDVWDDFGKIPCGLERVFQVSSGGMVLVLAGCGEMFTPHRHGHVYHDRKCARKAWARTSHGRKSLAAAKARWLETAWEYDRKRERDRKREIRAARRAA